ncbi:MAG: hypothetical protein AAF772_18725, partial [Acidobacteriota bacterium]
QLALALTWALARLGVAAHDPATLPHRRTAEQAVDRLLGHLPGLEETSVPATTMRFPSSLADHTLTYAQKLQTWLQDTRRPAHRQQHQGEGDAQSDLQRWLGQELQKLEKLASTTAVRADAAWIAMVRYLQDLVIDDLRRGGITIEANPTSNLLVGGLDSHAEHPVFRLQPVDLIRNPDQIHIDVSISTDDPGLLQVNLAEEYAALLSAAESQLHGYARHETRRWLTTLREIGWRSSFLRGPVASGADFLRYAETVTRMPCFVPDARRARP